MLKTAIDVMHWVCNAGQLWKLFHFSPSTVQFSFQRNWVPQGDIWQCLGNIFYCQNTGPGVWDLVDRIKGCCIVQDSPYHKELSHPTCQQCWEDWRTLPCRPCLSYSACVMHNLRGCLLTFQLDVRQHACDSFPLAAVAVGAAGTGAQGFILGTLALGVCFLTQEPNNLREAGHCWDNWWIMQVSNGIDWWQAITINHR